jgi:hypothetical protein
MGLIKAWGSLLLTQQIVPEEYIHEAKDEYYDKEANKYSFLEEGDTFPLGKGYVHWFTAEQLERELINSAFNPYFLFPPVCPHSLPDGKSRISSFP